MIVYMLQNPREQNLDRNTHHHTSLLILTSTSPPPPPQSTSLELVTSLLLEFFDPSRTDPFSRTKSSSSAGSIITHQRTRPHARSAVRSLFFSRSQQTKRTGWPSQYLVISTEIPPGKRSMMPSGLKDRKS